MWLCKIPLSAVQGVFRGLGDARTPLAATLGCNALNLALDPLLIFALGWGVAGAAQATVLAEVMTSCQETFPDILIWG